MDYAIRTRNLGKTYRLYGSPYGRFVEKLPWTKRPLHRAVHAVSDVSIEVPPGACVGLVGSNGSGKSTLLKLLAGTTAPSSGTIEIQGRVACLLELGLGFHREFTGRENVGLQAATLGISRRETLSKLDEIIAFSELGDFIDAPLRTYSAGMVCRLAFSIATAVDPDVLLIDEVLAVGDMHFQQKCARRFQEYKEKGKTIFFASHSLYHVRQICDRALWLKNGRVELLADAVTVTNEYATYENQLAGVERDVPFGSGDGDDSAGETAGDLPRIVSAELIDPATGETRNVFAPNDGVAVRVRIHGGKEPRPLVVAVGFFRQEGMLCFAHTTQHDGLECVVREAIVTLLLPEVRLLSGEYVPTVWLLDEHGVHEHHQRPASANLIIQNRGKDVGIFLHEHEWRIEALDAEEGPE